MLKNRVAPNASRGGHFDVAVLFTFLAVVGLEVAVFIWQAGPVGVPDEGTSHVDIGTRPPTGFALRRLGEEQQVNLVDLRDKVVWLVFWGEWSEPSRRQITELSKIFAELRDDPRFELVTVLCEYPTRQVGYDLLMIPSAEKFIQENELDLPVYLDETGDARRAFHILPDDYPTNVIIDAQGRVQGRWQNYFPELHDAILPVVKKWLEEVPGSQQRRASPAG
jgi:hypothetical protein